MLLLRRKRLWIVHVVLIILIVLLMWPVANWLQCRECRPEDTEKKDAVYLVAGAKDQDRRVKAVQDLLAGRRDPDLPRILIGNDTTMGLWSREDQRNPSMAEWAVKKLTGKDRQIEIVPGRFQGTDKEMETLAGFLAGRPEIRSLVLVTSPFHARRAVERLRRYADRDLLIRVVMAESRWKDRLPWTVLAELVKMARDRAGLSRVRFLSRKNSPRKST